ncbi:MAG: cullin, a subunit of ubiquitin ligase [Frankiales bacterium]|nr:cullin, a subunit of ubiquitin ligase [Frankiales bacterium]
MPLDLPLACPPHRQQISTRAQLKLAGITARGLQSALARHELVRVGRGVYSVGPLPPVGEHLLTGGSPDLGYLARVRATLLSLGQGCVAARRTAAVLWGFDMAVEPDRVEVDVPADRGRTSVAGVLAVRRPKGVVVPLRVLGLDAVPVTSAVQTVVDCAVALPLDQAVAIADSALRNKAVTRRQLVKSAAALRGTPGVVRVRRVIRLCDPRSGSVLESLLRVLLVLAGLRPTATQYVIREADGTWVGRVDFCWPGHRLVVECDGRRWHDPEDARTRDRRRDNALERLSWRVLRFTWAEVVHDLEYVISTVRACLRGWMAAA